ncbi:PQQ-binding-like beta-propeller repeat protein [Trichloromonas sp.]|uniref:outer membrane protein assembly factor BamB family protein n=1 Tax=Trichloromonas sp. TaxID=3069249 RepID=UPI003D81281D
MRLLLLLTLFLGACAVPSVSPPPPQRLNDVEIHQDTVWQGQIVIDGTVKVFKGAALRILPGSDIAFVRRDLDRDGLGDSVLIVEGSLLAEGTRAAPIRFRSAEAEPQPGDWLEIRVDFSRETVLRYCEISGSAYTLHAHFTKGRVEDCTIRHNIDGSRLGQARFVFANNLIEHNQGKGINFRNSTVEITRNIIRHNGSGIFLFENDRELSIHHNNIHDNLENFRLGDFYTGNVELRDNWWGTADPAAAALTIYDRKQDPAIGTVSLQTAPAWLAGCGPREAVELKPRWSLATGGYVDATVAADGEGGFVGSWDGRLYALDATGKTRWARELGEVIDSAAALDEQAVYLQTWGRRVRALDRGTGAIRWSFDYPASRADDHRQGGLTRIGQLLLVPAWNGTLYALDALSGKLRWQFEAGQPLRSAVATAGERLYVASGSGKLTALALDGSLLWQVDTGAPLLASPVVTPAGPVAVDREGRLSAWSADGQLRWQRELEETCYYAAPIYADGAIFLATAGGSLWKLNDQGGQVVWRKTGLGPVYATPRLLNGRLLVGDNDGLLHLYGGDSGDLLGAWTAGGAIQSTPALLADLLVFGARDQRVHALQLLDRPLPAAVTE